MSTPNPPLSLGILIETSLLTRQNRDAIIGTLKGLVENLRAEDEAAILVFSDQLDFEQDLTANDNLLEDAMTNLRPRPGKALLDGVAFAAGHLRRIGKNSNRVLLVISDGRSGRQSDLPISAEIKGVRIDCIGLNADGADQRRATATAGFVYRWRVGICVGPAGIQDGGGPAGPESGAGNSLGVVLFAPLALRSEPTAVRSGSFLRSTQRLFLVPRCGTRKRTGLFSVAPAALEPWQP